LPYKCQARGEEDFTNKNPKEILQSMVDWVWGLDGGLGKTCTALPKLFVNFNDSVSIQEITTKTFEHKLKVTKILLGSRQVLYPLSLILNWPGGRPSLPLYPR
jgi:hypothetical protein